MNKCSARSPSTTNSSGPAQCLSRKRTRSSTVATVPRVIFTVALTILAIACGDSEPKAPETELRTLLYCNQDWGNSPYKLLNDGNPHCETPCASFSVLEHHDGCTLVDTTPCVGATTVHWMGWTGCCVPHTKDTLGNYAGVAFVECN